MDAKINGEILKVTLSDGSTFHISEAPVAGGLQVRSLHGGLAVFPIMPDVVRLEVQEDQ